MGVQQERVEWLQQMQLEKQHWLGHSPERGAVVQQKRVEYYQT